LLIKWNLHEGAGKLKQQFANLSDDLLYKKVKGKKLLGRLQNKPGKTKTK
jgi:uncharacterized protein YjbJ (UPF0337 family)